MVCGQTHTMGVYPRTVGTWNWSIYGIQVVYYICTRYLYVMSSELLKCRAVEMVSNHHPSLDLELFGADFCLQASPRNLAGLSSGSKRLLLT